MAIGNRQSKEIWLGPLLGSNRARLIERCATLVSRGQTDSFLYLAASHPLLELVTEEILDGSSKRGLWGELPVYLFRGLVQRILLSAVNETGARLPSRIPIDREELPLQRSLISQILARLKAQGNLKAIGPLAGREGCVNSIATLMGEIERAAKSPTEVAAIIAARIQDLAPRTGATDRDLHLQIDFDREIALIYSTYTELLNRHQLTERDADQLRALSILNGELDGQVVSIPWHKNVQMLVLDGFFDFTPVQGEILRRLIPRIPEVVVNLNHDELNQEIFLPFQETVEHLKAIATFEIKRSAGSVSTRGALSNLRQDLFNPSLTRAEAPTVEIEADQEAGAGGRRQAEDGDNQVEAEAAAEIMYLECGDRDTEIRAIAKEIKRLVLREGYKLADIALVVRQRAAYAETISRVMREELLPCNLERRTEANDIPANRAALKLFAILEQLSRDGTAPPRTSEIADLIKSEYFRLNDEELKLLSARFDAEYPDDLCRGVPPWAPQPQPGGTLAQAPPWATVPPPPGAPTQRRYSVWNADALENAFAYVGSKLRVTDWLDRAQTLIRELPAAEATRDLLSIEPGEQGRDPDVADQLENAETAKLEEKDAERKRRPSRDVHPASIAWAALVIQSFAERIQSVPREGRPLDLRLALMKLFEQFSFRDQVARPIRTSIEDRELPQAIPNYNSLDTLRRAFAAAIKSIEIADTIGPPEKEPGSPGGQPARGGGPPAIKLATFLEEVRRCLSSQSQVSSAADRGGLRVLEATDVRGLRFRAVFIAGLVEGGFPLRASRDWIYPHEERERLKRDGLTLEDISPATLLKEEHYFYQSACRATERLYLSRPLLLEDDSETVASYYMDELRRAVAPLKIESVSIRRDYEGRKLVSASTTNELSVALVRQQERHLHRGEKQKLQSGPRIKRLLALARNDGFVSKSALRRIEIERERAGYLFGPYDGQITDPNLIKLLNQRFGQDFVHSASGLSVYGNCAYRFFGLRVLKLEPRGVAALDLQAIDAGKLLHDILRRFFEQHRREPLNELDREQLRRELAEIADRVCDEHERVVPPLNKQIWKIDREIRKILLDQVLLYELGIQQNAEAEGVVPAYFEIGFGGIKSAVRDPRSKEEPLELVRSTFVGEEAMKISGQIDRVDVARDNTLIAYDYKLSTGSSTDDIRSGRSLQLPIYLEALEKLILPDHRIAGGGYYVIRGGNERRNKGLHRAQALQYSKIRASVNSVVSDDEWRQIREEVIAKIWDFLDHMRAGDFSVNPSEKEKTCRFCDFAAVCRYDRYRIERKKEQPR
ncbi:MAG: PD-(D/E)XK nuclease family protein [Acidobacteriota bacterium]|nr:PD-(D/E)XK nuclease family protein [Acidobacteriota bacterium]